MTDEFESTLKTLLNSHVDEQVGPRRPAPPFEPPQVGRTGGPGRRRATWLTPLVAAACVVAVVAGGVGLSHLVSHGGTGVANSPTVASHPTPTRTPSAPTLRTVHGARIAVPYGWTLTSAYLGVTPGTYVDAAYCLSPTGRAADCTIDLYHLRTPTTTVPGQLALDVDKNDGFGLGDPPQYTCDDGSTGGHDSVSEIAQDSTFGGQPADLREWTRSCRGTVVTHELQAVVATDPGWALYVGDAALQGAGMTYARARAAFDLVAARSVLPPRVNGTVRLMDRGILTAASTGSSGVAVTIDRVWSTTQGQRSVIVDRHDRVTYTVPAALYDRATVKVGDQIALTTNGVTVTTLLRETPGR